MKDSHNLDDFAISILSTYTIFMNKCSLKKHHFSQKDSERQLSYIYRHICAIDLSSHNVTNSII